jgi:CrcB protein
VTDGASLIAALVAILVGGFSSVVRYSISVLLGGRGSVPWAVLVVNVAGSAIGGVALGLTEAGMISTDLRLIVLGGLAGGLTTFSTWSVETVELAQRGRWLRASISVGLNLVIGVAVAAGCWAGAWALLR